MIRRRIPDSGPYLGLVGAWRPPSSTSGWSPPPGIAFGERLRCREGAGRDGGCLEGVRQRPRHWRLLRLREAKPFAGGESEVALRLEARDAKSVDVIRRIARAGCLLGVAFAVSAGAAACSKKSDADTGPTPASMIAATTGEVRVVADEHGFTPESIAVPKGAPGSKVTRHLRAHDGEDVRDRSGLPGSPRSKSRCRSTSRCRRSPRRRCPNAHLPVRHGHVQGRAAGQVSRSAPPSVPASDGQTTSSGRSAKR